MNSNIEDDPWASGWNDTTTTSNDPTVNTTTTSTPFQSTYLTSSQLFSSTNHNHQNTTTTPPLPHHQASSIQSSLLTNVPNSYETVYSHLMNRISTVTDLELHVIDKLVGMDYLTNYQKQKLLDVIYDNGLLPVTQLGKFYQILGLLALEIDVPGTGDFVTLQFRLGSLPELPERFVSEVVLEVDEDPVLGNRNRNKGEDAWEDQGGSAAAGVINDPLLVDHSHIQDEEDEEGETTRGGGGLLDQPVLAGSSVDSQYIEKYINDLKDEFKPLLLGVDLIRIKEVPEKEGILFKHINYIITHDLKIGGSSSGTKKVIRRYSDFVWLMEYLLEKYPFRVIPGLPPKKFTGMYNLITGSSSSLFTNDNTHTVGASPDSQFLQRRRRGLHRFLNQLIKHPVLSQEPIVQTFLTVPTDLATWKKQAKIDSSLEFKGQKIQTNFMNVIWPVVGETFLKNWKAAEENIQSLIDKWVKIIILVERYERRQQQISFDNGRFVEMLNGFSKLNTKVYPDENQDTKVQHDFSFNSSGDITSINQSLNSIGEFFNKSSQILIDESYVINTTTLEKFKNYLDYLNSLQELFERTKKLSVNQIDTLDQRIKEQESRFKKISEENPDVKGGELLKLRQAIINDKQEIFQQLNKDWLIKQSCLHEFIYFQETQFLITEVWIEWCKDRFKCQEKLVGLYDNLNHEIINDMPLNR
ncbi:Sorting nexin MVP1 [Candida viswanathii]|uniref:Sorting nexin MVP1 n=1 Tax=Candida viswanathii TaxID=5486 RepID=A0A367YJF6_9ASCO|nr:Sorting nexin MVP1 [Candida viswanathii]